MASFPSKTWPSRNSCVAVASPEITIRAVAISAPGRELNAFGRQERFVFWAAQTQNSGRNTLIVFADLLRGILPKEMQPSFYQPFWVRQSGRQIIQAAQLRSMRIIGRGLHFAHHGIDQPGGRNFLCLLDQFHGLIHGGVRAVFS